MYVASISRLLLTGIFVLALSACGGGGGGGGSTLIDGGGTTDSSSGTGGGSSASTGTITLAISGMVDANGGDDNVLAGNEIATLTAEVTENGSAAELVVLFDTTIGRLLQDSAKATGGTATVQIAGDGTPGAATVTARTTLSDGSEISASITVQTSEESPTLSLLGSDGAPANAVELLAADTETITVQVLDWDKTPLPEIGVNFSANAVDLDKSTALTNSDGEVSVILTGKEVQSSGTLEASATFGSFSLQDSIIANSLGVNTDDNRIAIDAIDVGSDGVLDGNEKAIVSATVYEEGVGKDGISVTFSLTAGEATVLPDSATSTNGGVVSVQLVGAGIAGTAEITASATLSNGIEVSDTQIIQTSAVTPTLEIVVRNKAGAPVTSFGANEELTLEATISDHDGGTLDDSDAGAIVTFDVGSLGTVANISNVTSRNACPVNGIKANTDCAFVVMTSNAIEAVGEIMATTSINDIEITGTIVVTNTGQNSGSPDQNSFTLTMSVGSDTFAITDTPSIEGDIYNNQEVGIRVDLADFFNNPVPDGTLVEFTTELGDVTPSCETTDGSCSVTFFSGEPRSPINTETRFKTLADDKCPTPLVFDETVTIDASGDGLTEYRLNEILRVNLANTSTLLTENTDYTVTANGLDCITCTTGEVFEVTYRRAWLDEENDGDSTHVLATPGIATEPFLDLIEAPCLTTTRRVLEEITGDINPDGTTTVTGVGTRFRRDLVVGDRLKIGAEIRNVTSIASDTSLTVDTAFTDQVNDLTPQRATGPAFLGGLGQPYGARSTLLAFAVGEESFVDVNGNDEYDFGETFYDLTEAFMDKNEDGVLGDVDADSSQAGVTGPYRDSGLGTDAPGEARENSNPFCYGPQSIRGEVGDGNDSTENQTYCFQAGGEEELFIDNDADGVMDVGNGIYNGSRCLRPLQDADGDGEEDDIVCTTDLVDVRRSAQIRLAGSYAYTSFTAREEIIAGIVNRGGSSVPTNISVPEDWSAENATTLSNTFGARIDTTELDDNGDKTDSQEDVSLFKITNPFLTVQATYTLSFEITSHSEGAIEVYVGPTRLDLDSACNTAGTCTATDFTISSTDDLIFAVDIDGANFRFIGDVANVSLTGTSIGIDGDFSSDTDLVSNDLSNTALREFNVGDSLDDTTVFPDVSRRLAPDGVIPQLNTSLQQGTLYFTDRFNGVLPRGTDVTLSSDNKSGCSLASVGPYIIDYPDPGPDSGGPHSGSVTVGPEARTRTTFSVLPGGGGSGSIIATITTPIGNSVSTSISCNLLF